ncbi:MAG: glutathione S-transferase [Microgenomates group bacterium]
MQLYSSPTTPFGRKVAILIIEAGLQDRVAIATVSGTPLDPGTLPIDRNPLGKIPALILNDGRAIYDSRVICRYLDAQSGAGLYPKDDSLWDVLTLEATADGILEAALLMVYENRIRPEDKRFEPWVDGQWSKITRALDALETQWQGLLNGPLTAAHIAVACALGYVDFRHQTRDWRADRPKLATWSAQMLQRASVLATLPV